MLPEGKITINGGVIRYRSGNPIKVTIDVVSEAQASQLDALGREHDSPTERRGDKMIVDIWNGDHLQALKESCRRHNAPAVHVDSTGKARDCEWR